MESICDDDCAEVDRSCCILCQSTSECRLTSTENGRKRIRNAAQEQNDIVSKRLKMINGNDQFVYHMNNECYKRYTLKTSPNKEDTSCAQNVSPNQTRKSRRGDITPRGSNSFCEGDHQRTCVICGKIRHGSEHKKSRICDQNCANTLLQCASSIQDDVFVRICDLDSVAAVLAADIHYHKVCMKHYVRQYERKKNIPNEAERVKTDKQQIWDDILVPLKDGLHQGRGYELSSIRDEYNDRASARNLSCFVCNKLVKQQLQKVFGDQILFATCSNSKKSQLVLSANMSQIPQLVEKLSRDPLEICALQLRSVLQAYDFDLNDRFCDSRDLEHAWDTHEIPPPLLRFFTALFGTHVKHIEDTTEDDVAVECEAGQSGTKQGIEMVRMQALFQVMHFIIHNGRKRTPLHVMNSQALHETCKSKALIKAFNRYGFCSSYDETTRIQTGLANFIAAKSDGEVPIPSGFDPSAFTAAAFDNFDHDEATLSGIGGCHDTVTVLYQADGTVQSKPRPSEVGVSQEPRAFNTTLKCQKLVPFYKPAKRPSLPEDYIVPETVASNSAVEKAAAEKDFAWSLSRLQIDEGHRIVNTINQKQNVAPSWTAANSLMVKDNIPQTRVGFLPVLPYPVTQHDTVYTAMKNMQSVLKQLKQPQMAVACDEGVYRIAREIQLIRPGEFDNLVICLGTFHMAKIALGCLGKYLKNSGAEDIFIESSVFGVNVVESVMAGRHYNRSLRGFQLLNEAMTRLKMKEYLEEKGFEHGDALQSLSLLKKGLVEKTDDCDLRLDAFFENGGGTLMSDYQQFLEDRSVTNETFRFWNTFGKLFGTIQNLIRSDREGNWALHVETVQELLPLFAAFDSINYLRWCSLYIEDMRKLPEKAPDIFKAFCSGGFVVKRNSGKFRSVGMDMALEQTINRSQKSASGIIGNTRKKLYVAKWELVYHELLSISNLHRGITGTLQGDVPNHELNNADAISSERSVQEIINVVCKNGNPFSPDMKEGKLHNIMTKVVPSRAVRDEILNAVSIGSAAYDKFRNERYVKKTSKLSDTIHRANLKTFQTMEKKNTVSPIRETKKNDAAYERVIDVAMSRGVSMDELLKFDISHQKYLFDEDGMSKKATKSCLMQELERRLENPDEKIKFENEMPTTVVVDVMANIRKMKLCQGTFGEACLEFADRILSSSPYANRIDFVFDSYIERSVKDMERKRRQVVSPIELAEINPETKLPVKMESFWPSSANKQGLESVLHHSATKLAKDSYPDVQVIASHMFSGTGFNDIPCECVYKGDVRILKELDVPVEEADERIIPHVWHAVTTHGTERIVVMSSDTDVFILLMYYWNRFHNNGLKELWLKAGVADSTRYVPIHSLASCIGIDVCDVLPAVHTLTGSDFTSKVGTKHMALKADPENCLQAFGKESTLTDVQITKCEEYLVKVLKNGTQCCTMDELRIKMYYHHKIKRSDLPPTSHSILQHIRRSHYITYHMVSLLEVNKENLDPVEYGFVLQNGGIFPDVGLNPIPHHFAVSCRCEKCSTDRCACLREGVACSRFCYCRKDAKICQNPFSS